MWRLILVRHTAVDEAWAGLCYGWRDVPLSAAGEAEAARLTPLLARRAPQRVFHSGLLRARILAERIACAAGAELRTDDRLRERHFGAWEGCSWDSIYRADATALDRLVDEPDTFAPPGGETTIALGERVWSWYCELPAGARVLAVAHGGPIAAILGTLHGDPPAAWARRIPPPGGSVELP